MRIRLGCRADLLERRQKEDKELKRLVRTSQVPRVSACSPPHHCASGEAAQAELRRGVRADAEGGGKQEGPLASAAPDSHCSQGYECTL